MVPPSSVGISEIGPESSMTERFVSCRRGARAARLLVVVLGAFLVSMVALALPAGAATQVRALRFAGAVKAGQVPAVVAAAGRMGKRVWAEVIVLALSPFVIMFGLLVVSGLRRERQMPPVSEYLRRDAPSGRSDADAVGRTPT